MKVIAFDTSTSHGGVAVLRDDKVLSRAVWQRQGSHGELLTPQIQSCLEAAGWSPQDLEAVAVGIGPGSFTGVRVAINAARSLAFAISKPVFAFDTTEIIANGCGRADLPLLVIVNAHKNMVFASTFRRDGSDWKRLTPLEAREPEQLLDLVHGPHLCLGDGYDEYHSLFPPELSRLLVRDSSMSDYPQPEVLGLMHLRASPLDWKDVQALYIRESGAEEKLREDRKK